MKTLILGPTFVLHATEPPDTLADRLAAWAAAPGCPYQASRQGRHLQLAIPARRRHRWSPWLTVEVRDAQPMPTLPPTVTGETATHQPRHTPRAGRHEPETGAGSVEKAGGVGGAEVFARFNPSPAIWTGYILASLALLTIIFGAAMWATAELMLDRPPHALWVIPACLLVLALMWTASALGQRLAADEMADMRRAIEHAINPDTSPSRQ
ncbi:MAG: hypothetical protein ACF8Q5_10140 [Phycisphaerales bacterium JB040]